MLWGAGRALERIGGSAADLGHTMMARAARGLSASGAVRFDNIRPVEPGQEAELLKEWLERRG